MTHVNVTNTTVGFEVNAQSLCVTSLTWKHPVALRDSRHRGQVPLGPGGLGGLGFRKSSGFTETSGFQLQVGLKEAENVTYLGLRMLLHGKNGH